MSCRYGLHSSSSPICTIITLDSTVLETSVMYTKASHLMPYSLKQTFLFRVQKFEIGNVTRALLLTLMRRRSKVIGLKITLVYCISNLKVVRWSTWLTIIQGIFSCLTHTLSGLCEFLALYLTSWSFLKTDTFFPDVQSTDKKSNFQKCIFIM